MARILADSASSLLHEPFLGCWDDQFNGTASSYLLVSESSLVVNYPAYPPPARHDILEEHSSTFDAGSDGRVGVSLIASNHANNAYSPGLYSDFDMMMDPGGEGKEDDVLYYCQIDFDDADAAEAAKADAEVDYADLEKGCNNFTWSRMRRTDGTGCEGLLPDEGGDEGDAGASVKGASSATGLDANALTLLGVSFGAWIAAIF